jgi:hypothetical protein
MILIKGTSLQPPNLQNWSSGWSVSGWARYSGAASYGPTRLWKSLSDFKKTVAEAVLNLFTTVDGFRERATTGTKAEVMEIIGRYLQAIS